MNPHPQSSHTPVVKMLSIFFIMISGAIAVAAISSGKVDVSGVSKTTVSGDVMDNGAIVVSDEAAGADAYDIQNIDASALVAADDRFPYELRLISSVSTLGAGEDTLLVAATFPEQPRAKIMWGSDNRDVLTISTDGLARGVTPGVATVTAMVLDDEYYDAPSISFQITVTASAANDPVVSTGGVPAGNRDLPIANTTNLLSAAYSPRLVSIGTSVPTMHDNMQVTPETLDAYKLLYASMQAAGVGEVYIISGYRSYQRQSELLEAQIQQFIDKKYSAEKARTEALKSVQPPGASEHQLGLSIDLSTDGKTQENFHLLSQGRWITQNCHKFGFVIRYPQDKATITQIKFEPWHLRYVGVDHATYMYEHGLCLEEYVLL